MLVAVAERMYDPDLSDREVSLWISRWWEDPLPMILETPAMVSGRTKVNLIKMIGFEPEQIVNLLPPDNHLGTWSRSDACDAKDVLRPWAIEEGVNLLLLGRRVIDAFSRGAEFGTVICDPGIRMLCLPHPSGLNRFLNTPGMRKKVLGWVESFCARIDE